SCVRQALDRERERAGRDGRCLQRDRSDTAVVTIGGAGGRMLVSRPAALRAWRPASRDPLYGYLFILPQLVGFLVFIAGALATVFFFSLNDRNLLSGAFNFTGLGNYEEMVSRDTLFPVVLLNSLVFT